MQATHILASVLDSSKDIQAKQVDAEIAFLLLG
jgi:hypothetical protein